MKGFFIDHKVEIVGYSIFEHFFLGINKKLTKNVLCVIDTNRKDLAIQKIDTSGRLVGKTKTLKIDSNLVDILSQNYFLIFLCQALNQTSERELLHHFFLFYNLIKLHSSLIHQTD